MWGRTYEYNHKYYICLAVIGALFFVVHIAHAADTEEMVYTLDYIDHEQPVLKSPGGSRRSFDIVIENTTQNDYDVRISTRADDHFVSRVAFLDHDIDATLRETLEKNQYNVVSLCRKYHNNTKVAQWCNGHDTYTVHIGKQQTYRIPVYVSLAAEQRDSGFHIIVEKQNAQNTSTYEKVKEWHIAYNAAREKKTAIALSQFVLHRTPVQWHFLSGIAQRPQYKAQMHLTNDGTETVAYTYYIDVTPLLHGTHHTRDEYTDTIAPGETRDYVVDVPLPWWGMVRVAGGVLYKDHHHNAQEQRSEDVTLVLFPMRLGIVCASGICVCCIFVLLYKYLKKNMFGSIKKSQKAKKEQFTGTYIVQESDNIMSIAEYYNVSWKELVKHNNIEPPYILIAGESIRVPADADAEEIEDVAEDTRDPQDIIRADVMQEQYVAQKDDVPHTTSQKAAASQKIQQSAKTIADLEWMNDDEAAYVEEMDKQRKRTNRTFVIVIALILLLFAVIVGISMIWFMPEEEKEGVSVDTLIATNDTADTSHEQEASQKDDQKQSSSDNRKKPEQKSDEKPAENQEKDETKQPAQDTTAKADVTVQVLNAGAKTGAAGTVSNAIKKAGYKIQSARNAQNQYKNVTIYYKKGKKDIAQNVAKEVGTTYGTHTFEESDAVAKKYDADIVVVIGA